MGKLIIMQGLPASGKSTKAKELIAEHGNAIRVNKDLLRTMLHDDRWSVQNESVTQGVSSLIASHLLSLGKTVIIDDTNLNPSTIQQWVNLAKTTDSKIEYVRCLDVTVDECIARDSKRDKKVGAHIIYRMALQFMNYKAGEKIVICDLDGTLCDITHRLPFVKSKPINWDGFFEAIPGDSLRHDVLDQLLELQTSGHKIIFVSARPDTYRDITNAWLDVNIGKYGLGNILLMREAHDRRPDTEVKEAIYNKYLKHLNIIKVFDDRPSVIRMWREHGLDVVDVGNGQEF